MLNMYFIDKNEYNFYIINTLHLLYLRYAIYIIFLLLPDVGWVYMPLIHGFGLLDKTKLFKIHGVLI
jgi:hypothetical protein